MTIEKPYSPEFVGRAVLEAYLKLLGGRDNDMKGDGGADIIFSDVPGVQMLQVKNSWYEALKFVIDGISKKEFIPLVIGYPGQETREGVFNKIRENGYFLGEADDLGDKEKKMANILIRKAQAIIASDIPEKELEMRVERFKKTGNPDDMAALFKETEI